jgi:8-hydroxy-5-deazaflavin:NADPH oxidoreductase
VARLLAKSGISGTIANSRGPESLAALVGELGPSIKAGTAREAASADIVLVAVRWVDLDKALGGLPAWNGRIVVDGTNPVAFLDPNSPDAKDPNNPLAAYGIKAIDLAGKHSSDVFRGFVPGARVVKAFNHLDANALSEPAVSGGQRALFSSGRRCRREGRDSQDRRTDRLFSSRPGRARCRRASGLAAVRFACGRQFFQDLILRIRARSIGLEL